MREKLLYQRYVWEHGEIYALFGNSIFVVDLGLQVKRDQ